ncbi:hypothetical protein MPTK1_5g17350 [Marchantia polymorpha subsp. ruderalis]|uniref:Uncharacterized protein n=2 Tax=Marchantia polymorpha TaxID=3197 RepID=A0AAF6BJB6_MARPO|nr:hypothetical protein MARPO_0182s0014 [Marchantia polymorpha]BBN12100.1 hypothetical protein Mp_5g17350 [Marchantia polymorpha subsp. ruderalis]|eukprot:PTQ27833.1 hypothetical protein MARPO_0182s0014 [Marchantia polymorpha]
MTSANALSIHNSSCDSGSSCCTRPSNSTCMAVSEDGKLISSLSLEGRCGLLTSRTVKVRLLARRILLRVPIALYKTPEQFMMAIEVMMGFSYSEVQYLSQSIRVRRAASSMSVNSEDVHFSADVE